MEVVDVAAVPTADGALGQGQVFVRYDQVGIEKLCYTQAVADSQAPAGLLNENMRGSSSEML